MCPSGRWQACGCWTDAQQCGRAKKPSARAVCLPCRSGQGLGSPARVRMLSLQAQASRKFAGPSLLPRHDRCAPRWAVCPPPLPLTCNWRAWRPTGRPALPCMRPPLGVQLCSGGRHRDGRADAHSPGVPHTAAELQEQGVPVGRGARACSLRPRATCHVPSHSPQPSKALPLQRCCAFYDSAGQVVSHTIPSEPSHQ